MRQKPIPWKFGVLAAGLLVVAGTGVIGCNSGGGSPEVTGPLAMAAAQTIDPAEIAKFVTPLAIPEAMPNSGTEHDYVIVAGQTVKQILPAGMPETTVWGYGPAGGAITYPGRTIEATVGAEVTVKWINGLVDGVGNFLPHLLPVDQTLHWANPTGLCTEDMVESDCRGFDQTPYTGPVPIITHLHGAHVGPVSDGYPEAWYLPAATNIPADYKTTGRFYDSEEETDPGAAIFKYPNDQRATTLWYHDHTLGMTRLNVYAGLAGFYLLRGGEEDAAAEAQLPAAAYEIPIVIQDRTFNTDGSLFFPDNRAFFEDLEPDQLRIPFTPDLTRQGERSDVAPIWNPEFFGETMVVNGNTWPYLDVEPRRYRFRFLNGSDSRFLILTTADENGEPILTFHQIGADGGFLPEPAELTEILMAPAERADVIVDFSELAGQTVTLRNLGPDEPFGGGIPGEDFDPANPETTGQVMQFRISAGVVEDPSTPAAELELPAPPQLGEATVTRRLSLNEEESATVFVPLHPVTGEFQLRGGNLVEVQGNLDRPNVGPFGPTEAVLGIVDEDGMPVPLEWMAGISENPALNSTEIWEIYNFTMDAHPIHIHQVQFEIINRQELVVDEEGMAMAPVMLVAGNERGPEPWETGRKDTVIVYPGEVARIKAHFDLPGLFVWHCHILSHEDNEMMRPFCVGMPGEDCPAELFAPMSSAM